MEFQNTLIQDDPADPIVMANQKIVSHPSSMSHNTSMDKTYINTVRVYVGDNGKPGIEFVSSTNQVVMSTSVTEANIQLAKVVLGARQNELLKEIDVSLVTIG